MLTGAVGAGIGAATGGALTLLKVDKFGYQLVAGTVMGGVAGGVVSEIYGGNFWQGFTQGAVTAAAGFLFNQGSHLIITYCEDGFPTSFDLDANRQLTGKDFERMQQAEEEQKKFQEKRAKVIKEIGLALVVEGGLTAIDVLFGSRGYYSIVRYSTIAGRVGFFVLGHPNDASGKPGSNGGGGDW